MFHIILYEPEIPPNTGNIIRLCANVGARLHLIKPYGFEISDKQLRRAGLDYLALTFLKEYQTLSVCIKENNFNNVFAISTKGKSFFQNINYQKEDAFLFGPETRGLPTTVLENVLIKSVLRIPMRKENRSLNLSNCAAVVLYEAWRQQDFFAGE